MDGTLKNLNDSRPVHGEREMFFTTDMQFICWPETARASAQGDQIATIQNPAKEYERMEQPPLQTHGLQLNSVEGFPNMELTRHRHQSVWRLPRPQRLEQNYAEPHLITRRALTALMRNSRV